MPLPDVLGHILIKTIYLGLQEHNRSIFENANNSNDQLRFVRDPDPRERHFSYLAFSFPQTDQKCIFNANLLQKNYHIWCIWQFCAKNGIKMYFWLVWLGEGDLEFDSKRIDLIGINVTRAITSMRRNNRGLFTRDGEGS